MSKFIKCPECNSIEVISRVFVTGSTYVCMQTGEFELPEHCDYDVEDLFEFTCSDCDYEWHDEVPKSVIKMWRG